jgi:hypothetical protein
MVIEQVGLKNKQYSVISVDFDVLQQIRIMFRENIKISIKDNLGYYKLKKHTPWFCERC